MWRIGRALLLALVTGMPAAAAEARQEPESPAPAQSDSVVPPLFLSNDILEITLTADFGEVKKDRKSDKADYHPARMTYVDANLGPTSLPLRIKTRGNFRLQRDVCRFPPLRLNLRRSTLPGTLFAGQNKLKLVTHCDERREQYEENTILEYLLYRTYNLFTDHSYRARLVRFTYVEAKERGDSLEPREQPDSLTRYGFLIETDGGLAARNAARVLDLTGFHQYEMDPAVMTLVSVYQYFIGNTDWSLSALHNITLLSDADSRFLPVPYDFDWSGVVDARYAAPHPRLGTRSVRDRVFISGCLTEAELEPVMELFRARRDTVYALYRQQAGLEAKTVERTLEYFDDFFETIDDPKSFKREFVRGCPADE